MKTSFHDKISDLNKNNFKQAPKYMVYPRTHNKNSIQIKGSGNINQSEATI